MAEIPSGKFAWGNLGTGNIARQFCKGGKTCERGMLMEVGSRSAQPAAEFAGQFGVLKSYPTYEQVIKDPQVDAVYVSLPNSMHCEWTVRALEAGKHVLCEKPLASTEAEAKEMFAAARASGKTLIEAFMYRAHPQTREVMEKVRGG